MSSEFSVGNVVRLKSGGLPMTISSLTTEYATPIVVCVWFDANNIPQERSFYPAVLRMYEFET